jgi:diguanylate cyclase (GGDEF)-like protein
VTNAWLAAALGVVAVIDLALLWLVLRPALAGRRAGRTPGRDGEAGETVLTLRAIAALDPAALLADRVPDAAYDRIVRVASWAYLLSTAAVVYGTGLWPQAEDPLLLVLAIGGTFIIIAHDILPATGLGAGRFIIEGAVAITISSVVVVITGGAASPFFYAYPLVVAGAALVVRPVVTFGLACTAIAGYALSVWIAAGETPLDPGLTALAVVNVTALVLLSSVAAAIAREQRLSRDPASRLWAIDGLTGLAKGDYILAAVDREVDRATRHGRGFCLLTARLDGLKGLNKMHGHEVGDRALAAVAEVIRNSVRRIDTPARLGGDEFMVLLPETDREGARVVADKIRHGVAAILLGESRERVPVSVSIGLGEWAPGRTIDEMLAAADLASEAKWAEHQQSTDGQPLTLVGRDRVPVASHREPALPASPAARRRR